ncbi:hypothetical protein [Rhodoferax sp.]|uniref:hypothetical protein n=1 Tax=Rhodoferax sp. TaxID=50421 RepID=UPI00260F20DF|nr:hypothetical protein [Rhodoferax sp.]MDD2917620.1 hypothetical protein [Rhodoferax sp.]
MDSPLSILGSVASIGAAIWAFIEAKKAAQAATRAAAMRDEIIQRRRLIEVSQVYTDIKRILAIASEVGPSTNAKLLRGVDTAKLAKQIEEYARLLSEQTGHFSDFFGNEARALCERLKPDIEALADANTPEEKKAAGKSIYYSISAFMPIAKKVADGQREQTPKSLDGR